MRRHDRYAEDLGLISHLLDEPLKTCPWNTIDHTADLALGLRAYRHYKNGFLWYGGGIGDQPARILSMIDVIEDETGRIQRDEIEEAERKMARDEARAKAVAASGRSVGRQGLKKMAR